MADDTLRAVAMGAGVVVWGWVFMGIRVLWRRYSGSSRNSGGTSRTARDEVESLAGLRRAASSKPAENRKAGRGIG